MFYEAFLAQFYTFGRGKTDDECVSFLRREWGTLSPDQKKELQNVKRDVIELLLEDDGRLIGIWRDRMSDRDATGSVTNDGTGGASTRDSQSSDPTADLDDGFPMLDPREAFPDLPFKGVNPSAWPAYKHIHDGPGRCAGCVDADSICYTTRGASGACLRCHLVRQKCQWSTSNPDNIEVRMETMLSYTRDLLCGLQKEMEDEVGVHA